MPGTQKITGVQLLQLLEEDVFRRKALDEEPERPLAHHTITTWNEDPAGEWDNSLPTVVPAMFLGWIKDALPSAQRAWEKLRKAVPMVDLPSIRQGPFHVAGGAVSWALIGKTSAPADVDLFYVGTPEGANAALENLLKEYQYTVARDRLLKCFDDILSHAVKKSTGSKTFTPDLAPFRKWRVEAALAIEDSIDMVQDPIEDLLKLGFITVEGNDYALKLEHGVEPSRWDEFWQGNGGLGYKKPLFSIFRNRNAVTFAECTSTYNSGVTFQVILRVYARPEHIVLGFDLGASAVMFQFEAIADSQGVKPTLVLSHLGHFAYTTGLNVVDTTRLSRTFTYRLRKYAERGFGFVLPHLDIGKIPNDNLQYGYSQMVVLPGLSFLVERISAGGQLIARCVTVGGSYSQAGHDASDYSPGELEYYAAVGKNIRTLLGGGDNYFHLLMFEGEQEVYDLCGILDLPPTLSVTAVSSYYDKLAGWIWDGNHLNFKLFREHLQGSDSGGEFTLADCPLTLEEFGDCKNKAELLRTALRPRCEAMIKRWFELAEQSQSIKWMTEHPASQEKGYRFTGSFEPVYASDAEWYGKYFKA